VHGCILHEIYLAVKLFYMATSCNRIMLLNLLFLRFSCSLSGLKNAGTSD
jgi:hypothetical protein